uniref:Uncharacterized protein n=1 Tax=Oryza meridionalis TaxID=40149 RepID=A0A0E0CYX4_9ORYZ
MLSCCTRSARGPSPPAEEAYDEVDKSRRTTTTTTTTIKRQRRPVTEVSSRQPWNPFSGAVSRYKVHVALAEAFVYEFGRRRWFGFGQTRRLLVAETTTTTTTKGRSRRAGAPAGHRGRRSKPSDGGGTAAAVVDGREEEESTNVHFHLLVEDEIRLPSSSPAPPAVDQREKKWFPPGGYNAQCKPPVRITYADRCGPESLEAFLESVVAARGGGGSASSHGVPGNRWAEIAEAKARRQRYLRNYCPFQRDEEETTEAAGYDHATVKQPSNSPLSEGGDDTTTGVREKDARAVRGTAEYHVMRQEFLKSYQIRTFGEKEPRVPVLRRLLPRRKTAQIL